VNRGPALGLEKGNRRDRGTNELRRGPQREERTRLVHEKITALLGVNACQSGSKEGRVTPGRDLASIGRPKEPGVTSSGRKQTAMRQRDAAMHLHGRANPSGRPEDSGTRETPSAREGQRVERLHRKMMSLAIQSAPPPSGTRAKTSSGWKCELPRGEKPPAWQKGHGKPKNLCCRCDDPGLRNLDAPARHP